LAPLCWSSKAKYAQTITAYSCTRRAFSRCLRSND